jgi:RNA polymerase sigma-B factor
MAVSPSSSQATASEAVNRSAGSRQQQTNRRTNQPTNQSLLRRLGGSRAAAARLHWRNALVSQNLGLVHMVANRESLRSGRPFDDLCSAGYEGLIRAVECFDTSRNGALSSFAVPYIQGAMRMDQRERQQPLRTPRRLRELQQRARRLQEKRRAAGQSPLAAAELAEALGCSLARLQEADAVQRALGVASLDQPRGEGDGEEQSGSWLEQISERSPRSRDEDDSQLQWLRRRMGGLEAADRELLEARWIDGLSWSAVAERMGMDSRQCRQRAGTLRRALQGASSQVEASRAKAAARAV